MHEAGSVKPQMCTADDAEPRWLEATEMNAGCPPKKIAFGDLLCLDAFRIVLNDHDASNKQWFVSTVNLQMASLQFCIACRLARVYHVRVATFSPWIVDRDHEAQGRQGEDSSDAFEALQDENGNSDNSSVLRHHPRHASRIPRLRLRRMTWELSTSTSDRQLATDMHRLMIFGDDFSEDVRDAMFPPLQQRLTFGRDFNRALRRLSPVGGNAPGLSRALRGMTPSPVSSLQELALGSYFNEEVDESVLLPPTLRKLTFGSGFNRPIDRIKWPPAIRHLVFGWRFNQIVQGVRFPSSLETLEFGFSFNQPVREVCWPTSLRQLTFGDMFSQDIGGGNGAEGGWPESLEKLTFGDSFNPGDTTAAIILPKRLVFLALGNGFNQPIDRIQWPVSLWELQMGDRFNRPINRARWPDSLKRLTFGAGGSFNKAIDAVRWPRSLEVLEFGWKFNQPITRAEWPSSLRELSFGWDFDQAVVEEGVGVRWPASLQKLTFGQNFNQPLVTLRDGGGGGGGGGGRASRNGGNNGAINSVSLPASLQQLEFGGRFQQPLEGVVLPPSLVEVILGYQFNHPIDRVAWPSSLRRLTLGGRFNHALRELPAGLTELVLPLDRDDYRYSLTEVTWPPGLTKLTLPFGMDLDGVVLPPGARVIRYRYHAD